jgi:isocitrate dehydrogenase
VDFCKANGQFDVATMGNVANVGLMAQKAEVYAAIEECYKTGCKLAMVDSDNGITNLHVPSDVIIDASMPNVIRDSGGMYNAAGKLEATKAMIPDRS